MTPTLEQIKTKTPCLIAVHYLNTKPDINTAWKDCKRADWMFWLMTKFPRKTHIQPIQLLGELILEAAKQIEYDPLDIDKEIRATYNRLIQIKTAKYHSRKMYAMFQLLLTKITVSCLNQQRDITNSEFAEHIRKYIPEY